MYPLKPDFYTYSSQIIWNGYIYQTPIRIIANFCQKLEEYKKEGRPIVCLDESGFAHEIVRSWILRGNSGAMKATIGAFTSWVKQDLLPNLSPKSVIVLDNASFHKGKEMRQTVEASGHVLLYMPPYSSDLNPIERK